MQHQRIKLLLGDSAMARLRASRVAVFGLGGVGGYVVEALARSGVGALDLVDCDDISITNLNRQILATHSTLGISKALAARDRVLDIDPEIQAVVHECFFTPDTADRFDFTRYDYVVDAIDTITGKLCLISLCKQAGTPIISAMGAGNKLDPTALRVADISKTSVCPLARIMRKECARRGIRNLKVVYSTELPLHPQVSSRELEQLRLEHPGKNALPGSCVFVPAAMGLTIAAEVVKDLTHDCRCC